MTHTLAGPSTAADWAPIMDALPAEIFGLAVSYEKPIPRTGYELIFFEGAFALPEKLGTKIPLLLGHDRSRVLADRCQFWEGDDGLQFSATIRDARTIEAVASRELFPSISFAAFRSISRDGLLAVGRSFLREISLVANPACKQSHAVALRTGKLVRPTPRTRYVKGNGQYHRVATHSTWHHAAMPGAWHRAACHGIF